MGKQSGTTSRLAAVGVASELLTNDHADDIRKTIHGRIHGKEANSTHHVKQPFMWSVCVICVATELSSCSPAGRPMGHVIQGRLHLFIAGMPNRGAPLLNIPNGCTRKETSTGLDKLFVYEAI